MCGFLIYLFLRRKTLKGGFYAYCGFFVLLLLGEGLDLYFWSTRVVSGPFPLIPEIFKSVASFSLGFFLLLLLYHQVRFFREEDRQREARQQLKESQEHQKTLLREVHHRVKNNFQAVLSLIGLQKKQVESELCKKHLDRVANRIRSMVLLHEHLQRNGKQTAIQTDEYLRTLLGHLRSIYSPTGDVSIEQDLEPIELDPDDLIPCGMVLSELVGNACEHAFVDREPGHVVVRLFTEPDGEIVLRVKDDGVGGVTPEILQESQTLGMRLVRNLVQNQLGGELSVTSNGGTTVEIRLPDEVRGET